MKIGRLLCPVRELGPGERLGIWVQGCDRKCPGCANPELWSFDDKKETPLDILVAMTSALIAGKGLTGITITGGEPMLQPKELAVLLSQLKPLCSDLLVFTGFTYDDLRRSADPDIQTVLSLVSVLVDGEYIREQNAGDRLRGSANQRVLFLEENMKTVYEQYMGEKERHIDNFIALNGVISVGIHPQEFLDQAWGMGEYAGMRSAE